ncbi:hypothetical protein BDN70DRAFT_886507 [Pholiota conissans]|uniref:RING-type domain-containing protein n=1 Tax=Pholiota conissans TaxID=109636 RepID=A0A9P5YPS4_9AGAR|nr:hypothetical protein BDN70DRAFT_886507 [Pholiota conissans]
MSLQCSICLCSFKEPVCLPCGHIYCKQCLSDHVNVPTNTRMTSTCPDCRTTFHIAIPDLTYLPAKYHPFISTAVRRVFIDDSEYVAMQKKVKQMEKQFALFRQREESYKISSAELVSSLERAKSKARGLEKRVTDDQTVIQKLEHQVEKTQEKYLRKSAECKKLAARVAQLEQEQEQTECSGSDEPTPMTTPPKQRARTIKPLPRRAMIQRRVREDTDSPSPNLAHSKRQRLSNRFEY